jgi:hypothetical protein
MKLISTPCLLGSTLAVLTLFADCAIAAPITVHPLTGTYMRTFPRHPPGTGGYESPGYGNDGGGFRIRPNGGVQRVPPMGPVTQTRFRG